VHAVIPAEVLQNPPKNLEGELVFLTSRPKVLDTLVPIRAKSAQLNRVEEEKQCGLGRFFPPSSALAVGASTTRTAPPRRGGGGRRGRGGWAAPPSRCSPSPASVSTPRPTTPAAAAGGRPLTRPRWVTHMANDGPSCRAPTRMPAVFRRPAGGSPRLKKRFWVGEEPGFPCHVVKQGRPAWRLVRHVHQGAGGSAAACLRFPPPCRARNGAPLRERLVAVRHGCLPRLQAGRRAISSSPAPSPPAAPLPAPTARCQG